MLKQEPAGARREPRWRNPRYSRRGRRQRVTSMTTTASAHRAVRLERIGNTRYLVTNDRGGQITIGSGGGTDFTPVDLGRYHVRRQAHTGRLINQYRLVALR